MIHLASQALLSLPVCLAPLPALPQETSVLLRDGELIDGHELGYSGGATIDDDGHWWTLVHVDLGAGERAAYLLRDGTAWLRAGQRITQPSAMVLNPGEPVGGSENRAVIVVLEDVQPPLTVSGPHAAVLRNERALVIQGELLGVSGLPASARCGRIDALAANTHDTVVVNMLVSGAPTLLRFRFAADGTELARERLLAAGDDLGAGRIVASFSRVAVDERGDWLVRAATEAGGTFLVGPAGVVLGSGDASPLAGRLVQDILRYHDGDEFGGVAAALRLDGDPASDQVLVVNGALLAQEGDLIPSLSPLLPARPLVEIGPLRRARSGVVFWQAVMQAGNLAEGSLLRGELPFLETGVSVVAGETVLFFYPSANNAEISPDGRFWLGRVYLAGGDEAYVRVDFGTSEPRPGCTPQPGSLRHTDGLVLAGATLALELDAPAPSGAQARVHLSTLGPGKFSDCGVATPFGERLVDPAGRFGVLLAGAYSGTPLTATLAIPASSALVDLEFFAQGSFLAAGSVQLTNGLRFEIGAP
jgi:hypothetical protein